MPRQQGMTSSSPWHHVNICENVPGFPMISVNQEAMKSMMNRISRNRWCRSNFLSTCSHSEATTPWITWTYLNNGRPLESRCIVHPTHREPSATCAAGKRSWSLAAAFRGAAKPREMGTLGPNPMRWTNTGKDMERWVSMLRCALILGVQQQYNTEPEVRRTLFLELDVCSINAL